MDKENTLELKTMRLSTGVRHSIRTKLIIAIAGFAVLIMSVTSVVLVNQKRDELIADISRGALSYGELDAGNVASDFDTLYQNDAFIEFTRVIRETLKKMSDVRNISVIGFDGEIYYDSEVDRFEKYSGEPRFVSNDMRERVQAPFISVNSLTDERTVYYEKDVNGELRAVNLDGEKISDILEGEMIGTVIVPVESRYAVAFDVSYSLLETRIAAMYVRIGLLLFGGCFFGALIAIVLGSRFAAPIRSLKSAVEEIALGHFDHRVDVHTHDELGVLGSAINRMANDLKKATHAMLYKERVTKELEIAKDIQKSLIPQTLPTVPGIDLSASVHPAEEIGGDCYDVITFKDRAIMYLGDVTGHGVPSGLLVSVANALIYDFADHMNLKAVMVRTNRVIHEKSKRNMFITMVMLEWNTAKKELKYVSAGHEKLMHFSVKTKKVTELDAGGIALGMVGDCEKLMSEVKVKFEKGDFVIAYSDGIPEAFGPKREQYGFGRLRKAFYEATAHREKPTAQSVHDAIIADVNLFRGRSKQADDITLLVIGRKE